MEPSIARAERSTAVARAGSLWVALWWVHLPAAARRLSSILADALTDGYYLVAFRPLGALAPPVALLIGLWFGWFTPGFSEVFTESLFFLLVAAVLGVLSGNLGVLFVIGFAFGDFFIAHPEWTGRWGVIGSLLRVRIPLLIQYGLLTLLCVNVPVVSKSLVSNLRGLSRFGPGAALALASLLHAAVTFILVYFWTQAVPILIRPIFTWTGGAPTVSAMSVLQSSSALTIAGFAVAASLIRMALQAATAVNPAFSARVEPVEAGFRSTEPAESLAQRLPPPVRVTAQGAWATLMLSGMLLAWIEALLLFALIWLVGAARAGLVRLPVKTWQSLVEHVPFTFRIAATFTAIFFAAQRLTEWAASQPGGNVWGFRLIILVTAIALVISFLLNPGLPEPRKREGAPAA